MSTASRSASLRPACCLFVVLLFAGFAGTPFEAQVLYGSKVGNVRDATGGVLPGAAVTITHSETKTARETVTDTAGSYRFPTVQTDTYTVDVSLAGFQRFARRRDGHAQFVLRSICVRPMTEPRFGNAGFSILRRPGVAQWDVGLFRRISFGRRANVQLQVEAFNVTNRPHFGNPGTNRPLNPDGSIRSLNGYTEITGTSVTRASGRCGWESAPDSDGR